MTTIAVFYKNMKRFVVTIFHLRHHGFQKINIVFTNGEITYNSGSRLVALGIFAHARW